jgi:glycosyltransferase involved in cell wall biosynthesis
LLTTRAIPSVLRQTHRNFELIVCAHGCTDGTEAAVMRLKLQGYCIRLVSVPRTETYPPTAENHWLAGPVVPINAGLAHVSGGWIARIDDDDEWTEDHLKTLLSYAQRFAFEFVSSAHETHEGKVGPYDLDGVKVGGVQTWLYRSYLRFMKANPDCWRKSWDRVNDTDLQRRMRNAGVRMGYLDKVTARILPRPGETKIGLAAYREDAARKEQQFAF